MVKEAAKEARHETSSGKYRHVCRRETPAELSFGLRSACRRESALRCHVQNVDGREQEDARDDLVDAYSITKYG